MKEERVLAKENIKKTLASLKELDEHIALLDYQCDYDLEAALAAGLKSEFASARFLQKLLHTAKLVPNPLAGHSGCSAFNAKTPDGKVIMGRNFDYKEARVLVIWTHPKKGYRGMAVCNQNHMMYADLRKARRPLRALAAPYVSMDGINEKGFACAILELITKPTKQERGKTPITTIVAVRGMLDTCATVDEAIAFLSEYDMHDLLGACYHYFLTDASGSSAIVEYMNNEMYVYRQDKPDDNLKLTNFFITPGGVCNERGRDRYEIMDCRLRDKPILTEDEAMDLLSSVKVYFRSHYKIFMISTSWSAVYNCTERSMYLCAGKDYKRRYRLRVDEPLKAELIISKSECSDSTVDN